MSSSQSFPDTQQLLENALGRPAQPYVSRLRQINWRWRDVLLGLLVLLAWRLAMMTNPLWIASLSVRWQFFFSAGFPALWMFLFPFLMAKQQGVRHLFSQLRWRHVGKEVLIAIPVVVLLTAALALVTQASVYFGGEPLGTASETVVRSDIVALLVLSIVIAPLAEELFFRGFLYNCLRRNLGTWMALLAQAGLFAIMHSYSTSRTLVVFGLGLALGAVYQWRKTLVTPVLIHASLNSIAALATLLFLLATLAAGSLGVTGKLVDQGFLVEAVQASGPAEQAGVLPGDLILEIADQPLDFEQGLGKLIRLHQAGDTISLLVERNNAKLAFEVTLAQKHKP
jgi:membrane protease YdiL (CAAX protease family)